MSAPLSFNLSLNDGELVQGYNSSASDSSAAAVGPTTSSSTAVPVFALTPTAQTSPMFWPEEITSSSKRHSFDRPDAPDEACGPSLRRGRLSPSPSPSPNRGAIRSPRQYVVEVLSDEMAKVFSDEMEKQFGATDPVREPSLKARDVQRPPSPALLLCPGPQDLESELRESVVLADERDGESWRSNSVSQSSDEGEIRDRLKESLLQLREEVLEAPRELQVAQPAAASAQINAVALFSSASRGRRAASHSPPPAKRKSPGPAPVVSARAPQASPRPMGSFVSRLGSRTTKGRSTSPQRAAVKAEAKPSALRPRPLADPGFELPIRLRGGDQRQFAPVLSFRSLNPGAKPDRPRQMR